MTIAVTNSVSTFGAVFPANILAGQDPNAPLNVSVLNLSSTDATGDYIQIVIDGVVKATVRIKP